MMSVNYEQVKYFYFNLDHFWKLLLRPVDYWVGEPCLMTMKVKKKKNIWLGNNDTPVLNIIEHKKSFKNIKLVIVFKP